MKKNNITRLFFQTCMGCLLIWGMSACSESQSYSDLLNEEEHATNWYLASQKIELEIPADSVSFITGEDAPYYKLDEDGYVYMQVISKGDSDNRVKDGDLVYFRYNRLNLKDLYKGLEPEWEGNSEDVSNNITQTTNYTRFVYGDQSLSSSTQWGTGIQMPLRFFGYNCEVNLVLRSYYGFSSEQTQCLPFLINLRYFAPEY